MKRVNCILLIFIFILAVWCNASAGESKNSADYAALFPSPLKGWEASEVTVKQEESILWGTRLILTRIYYSQSNGGQVTIQLDTENLEKSIYIKTFKSANPDEIKLLEKDGFIKFNYQSYHGIKVLDNEKYTAMIVLEIKPGGILEINADKFWKNKGIVMEFLEITDLQKISAFMKQH